MSTSDVLIDTYDLDLEMGCKALGQLELALLRLSAALPGTDIEKQARALSVEVRELHTGLEALLADLDAIRPATEVAQ